MAPYIPGGHTAQLQNRIYSPPTMPGHIPGAAALATPPRMRVPQVAQSRNDGNALGNLQGLSGYSNAQSLMQQAMPRFDAVPQGGLFLSRWLQQKLPRVLFRRFPELPLESGKAFSIKYDLQPGVNSVTQDLIDFVGQAKVLADEAFDIPLVDISSSEDEYKVIAVAAGYHYTLRQIEAAQFANVPLRDRKMFIARRVIAEKMNSLYAYGFGAFGFTGLFNNPNVPVIDSTFNSYTTSATQADDVTAFYIDVVSRIYDDTLMTEKPSRWLVPIPQYTQLIKLRIPNTNLNVLQYVLSSLKMMNPDFEIIPMNENKSVLLEANGVHAPGLNKDRMVVFPASDDVIEAHAQTVQSAPMEYSNMKFVCPMYQVTTQPIWQYTTGAKYIQIPKAA